MGKAFLLMLNHNLSPAQLSSARKEFGPCRPIEMPGPLRNLWQQVPADASALFPFLGPFRTWLEDTGRKEDFVIIQGDFGATFLMVNHALDQGMIPVYATTRRKAVETLLPDGSVKMEHVIKFCRFRTYGK